MKTSIIISALGNKLHRRQKMGSGYLCFVSGKHRLIYTNALKFGATTVKCLVAQELEESVASNSSSTQHSPNPQPQGRILAWFPLPPLPPLPGVCNSPSSFSVPWYYVASPYSLGSDGAYDWRESFTLPVLAGSH